MNSSRTRESSERLLAAYVDGEVTPSEAEAVEAAVLRSVDTRRQVEALKQLRAELSSPVPELESVDLVGSLRSAMAAAPRTSRQSGWRWFVAACVSLSVAALALLVIRVAPLAPTTVPAQEFRAKSARTAASDQPRWAGIQAYHIVPGQEPRRILERLPRDAGLLFSYTNLGGAPFDFLMIFSVDARGSLRWCYPAYERANTDPTSIPIQKGVAEQPLNELIRFDLARGRFVLHALFSMRPLRVSQVEAWWQTRDPTQAQPWPGVAHQMLELEVEP